MRSWSILPFVLVAACAGHDRDAQGGQDGGAVDAIPVRETCTDCVQIAQTGAMPVAVQGDGTNIYALFDSSPQTLVQIAANGDRTTIATSDAIGVPGRLSGTAMDALLYVIGTGTSYAVHQRAGATDTVLGTITSIAGLHLGGNATDVYAYGSETRGKSTLWRIPRAGGAVTVVGTVDGNPGLFSRGVNRAAVSTDVGNYFLDLPGPSTSTAFEYSSPDSSLLAMTGDTVIALDVHMLTSHTRTWAFVAEPGHQVLGQTTLTDGSIDLSTFDDRHYYYVETDGLCRNGCTYTHRLNRDDLGWIATWPGEVLGQDATHLYGIEPRDDGSWLLDVLAK